jgi:hypothetical protein
VRVVTVPNHAPHDLHRHSARVLTFREFPGRPVPGESIALRLDGGARTVPGFVYCVNDRDDIVIVDEDHHPGRYVGRYVGQTATTEGEHHRDW